MLVPTVVDVVVQVHQRAVAERENHQCGMCSQDRQALHNTSRLSRAGVSRAFLAHARASVSHARYDRQMQRAVPVRATFAVNQRVSTVDRSRCCMRLAS